MPSMTCIIVPWHNPEQLRRWCDAWNIRGADDKPHWLKLVQDSNGSGCAKTKNKGIKLAIEENYKTAIILDDDCFPTAPGMTLEDLAKMHVEQLRREIWVNFFSLTTPSSRGTPHKNRSIKCRVAASMGYWTGVGDVDAVTQVYHGIELKNHCRGIIHYAYFPLCGMNLAFDLDWWPWCQFIDVPRYDDIWMGWLWMKRAYATGCCFSTMGPDVYHERQSDMWKNLAIEAPNMKANEELWETIARHPGIEYDELRKLLPC